MVLCAPYVYQFRPVHPSATQITTCRSWFAIFGERMTLLSVCWMRPEHFTPALRAWNLFIKAASLPHQNKSQLQWVGVLLRCWVRVTFCWRGRGAFRNLEWVNRTNWHFSSWCKMMDCSCCSCNMWQVKRTHLYRYCLTWLLTMTKCLSLKMREMRFSSNGQNWFRYLFYIR